MIKKIYSFLSIFIFMVFGNNTIQLNAEASNSELFPQTSSANFIENFFVEEQELNSTLNPKYEEYDNLNLYYKEYIASSEINIDGVVPEWHFQDVLYNYDDQYVNYTYEVDGVTYISQSSFLKLGNDKYRKSYDNEEIYSSKYYENYSGEINVEGFINLVKVGFSSVNGISLIANDIYLNSVFDASMAVDNNKIDLAFVNESGFNINWLKYLNILSKSYADGQFKYPLVKIDNNEYVNVVFNGTSAYIVTHNCEFAISNDNSTIYLSIPYIDYIEKVTISVPFFIGGFTQYLTQQNFDQCYIPTAYLVGEEIRSEIVSVMNGFVPYLFNDDINNNNESYVKYTPLKIDSFDKENSELISKSVLGGTLDINSITYVYGSDNKRTTLNLDFKEKIYPSLSYDKDGNLITNREYYSYVFSFDSSTLSFNTTTQIRIIDIDYTFTTDLGFKLDGKFNLKDNVFTYFSERSALTIYGDAKYELKKNPSYISWALDMSMNINVYTFGDYHDEWKSYREFLYFDFYFDSAYTDRIEEIDSIYMAIPLNNGTAINFYENKLQTRIEEHLSSDDVIDKNYLFEYYPSRVENMNNVFGVDLTNGESGTLMQRLYDIKTDETSCRFFYSNYLGVMDSSLVDSFKLGINNDLINSKKLQAELTLYINADTIVKATTNQNGLHREYDDAGTLIGVFNGNGELQDGYSVNDYGQILDENGNVVSGNWGYEDITNEDVYKSDFQLFLDSIVDLFKSDGSFIDTTIQILSITLLVIIIVAIGYGLYYVVSWFRDKWDSHNLNEIKKSLKYKNKQKVKKKKYRRK